MSPLLVSFLHESLESVSARARTSGNCRATVRGMLGRDCLSADSRVKTTFGQNLFETPSLLDDPFKLNQNLTNISITGDPSRVIAWIFSGFLLVFAPPFLGRCRSPPSVARCSCVRAPSIVVSNFGKDFEEAEELLQSEIKFVPRRKSEETTASQSQTLAKRHFCLL